jgi:hypothetical protein
MAFHDHKTDMESLERNGMFEIERSVVGAPLEPFVDADTVAEFLAVERRQVLNWARSGDISAHPLGHGKRRMWRFRLTEVEAAVLSWRKPIRNTIVPGSPRSQKGKL